jgi:hypothetical protein
VLGTNISIDDVCPNPDHDFNAIAVRSTPPFLKLTFVLFNYKISLLKHGGWVLNVVSIYIAHEIKVLTKADQCVPPNVDPIAYIICDTN